MVLTCAEHHHSQKLVAALLDLSRAKSWGGFCYNLLRGLAELVTNTCSFNWRRLDMIRILED
ncbi:hypothetical protein ETB97_009657 [Aspergillus alliaceus]|uniref:Uncharacterized protein n=1 Tax=Petromyces alliaceus TaxID=209559 RepID=A0A8H5ZTW0_PETAA|nr:hypothetical protein ETB97_009657 [Aspergillus burnettii]